jgi:hypothetical protein
MLPGLTTFIARHRPPMRRRRNPVFAAFWGLLLGGIGVGLYLRSLLDGLIAFGLAMVGYGLFAVTHHPATALLSMVTPGLYGFHRVRLSNRKLAVPA